MDAHETALSAGIPARISLPDGGELVLEDTLECKVKLKMAFLAQHRLLSLGRPEVPGGCPGSCPKE